VACLDLQVELAMLLIMTAVLAVAAQQRSEQITLGRTAVMAVLVTM